MSDRDSSTSERWQRADRILEAALDAAPEQRAQVVADACGDDVALRAEVERLLEADARNDAFLERPAPGLEGDTAPETGSHSDESGLRLGPYRLLRRIGQGGMGAVYLAERTDGEFERRVAIKLLRDGHDEAEAVARFQRERQSLAHLQHPHIARLHDGGRGEDGRPYLVMEHVEGSPIDRYCERERLPLEARLRLFQQVCAAVQHAHGHLIVHRDLKPANILVSAEGEAKLLDFGIAKRLSPAGEDTRTHARVMTPLYASPEQVRGGTITTASDVYGLGVVLFQLLCGRLPYRAGHASSFEVERAVLEEQPPAPSAVAQDAALRRRLRGDLDAIVLKALRKEPDQRYTSVALLSQDISQYLAGQPVTARRGSLAYSAGRFVRRNRLAVATAAVVLAVLLGLLARLAVQGRRLAAERDKARQALDVLVQTFAQPDPYQGAGERITAREVLDRGAAQVVDGGGLGPEIQAPLLNAIGRAYLGLGLPAQAAPLIERAAEVSGSAASTPAWAASREVLAELRIQQGRMEEAERLFAEALSVRARISGPDAPETTLAQIRLGSLQADRERFDAAEGMLQRALDLRRRRHGQESPEAAEALRALGRLRYRQAQFAESIALQEEALDIDRRTSGADSPQVARALNLLAETNAPYGQLDRAERLGREALAIQERRLGEAHPDTVSTLSNLGTILHHRTRLPEAEATFRTALARYRTRVGPRHPDLAAVLQNLGAVVAIQGRPEEAAGYLEEALGARREIFGARSEPVAETLSHLARLRFAERFEEAFEMEGEALDILTDLHGPEHPGVAMVLQDIGQLLLIHRRPLEAERYLHEGLGIRERILPPGHPELAYARSVIGSCLTSQRRYAEAEVLLLPAERAMLEARGADHLYTQRIRRRLRELYEAWGRPDKAREYGPPEPSPERPVAAR